MAKIEKLPSGAYRIRVYNKLTGSRKSFTAPTKAEVKRMAGAYLNNMEEDESGNITIKSAILRYIDNRRSVLSPSTLKEYLRSAESDYKSIEHILANRITSEQIQAYVSECSATAAPKTVKNRYGLLVSAIHAIYPDKRFHVLLPQNREPERHMPTEQEVKLLLDNSSGNLKKAIILASIGTLRRGEICALDYSDITDDTIYVHADMVKGIDGWVIKKNPKTDSSNRYIQFPAEAIAALGEGEGRIVTCSPGNLTNKFTKLRDKLGLKCHFHELRHFAATAMHYLGVPDETIMQRGGWSTDNTLKTVYRHVLKDKHDEFVKQTNDYMKSSFF